LVLSIIDRQPLPLLIFSGLLLFQAIGSVSYFHSRARFLLPAFPLLLPIALGLARTPTSRAVAILTLFAVVSAYFGAYLLLVWAHSP
jgi:hypothetical protein